MDSFKLKIPTWLSSHDLTNVIFRYVHFGVNLSCLVAKYGHIIPFYARFRDFYSVLYQSLGLKTKYSEKCLLLLPNLFHEFTFRLWIKQCRHRNIRRYVYFGVIPSYLIANLTTYPLVGANGSRALS